MNISINIWVFKYKSHHWANVTYIFYFLGNIETELVTIILTIWIEQLLPKVVGIHPPQTKDHLDSWLLF